MRTDSNSKLRTFDRATRLMHWLNAGLILLVFALAFSLDLATSRASHTSLLSAIIEKFESYGSGELYLETNSALKPAIKLYEAAGFVHATRPTGPVRYKRSDGYMVYRGQPRAEGRRKLQP